MFAIQWYVITGWCHLSSGGRCVPYGLVVLLIKEYGDTDMAYRWDAEVHHHLTGNSSAKYSTVMWNVWAQVSLRFEITIVTSKQLTVLVKTIWISNAVMKGYWVQLSTCEVCVWIKMGLIPPDYWSWCITVFQFSIALARIIHEMDLNDWNIMWMKQSRLIVNMRSS